MATNRYTAPTRADIEAAGLSAKDRAALRDHLTRLAQKIEFEWARISASRAERLRELQDERRAPQLKSAAPRAAAASATAK